MANFIIPDDLLDLLRKMDTPTVCNAIEVAQGKRGFNRFTRGHDAALQAGRSGHCGLCPDGKNFGVGTGK